ncbi:MAG: hypothetical protein U9N52_12945 [Campylobacterota bacterium]|nr:hypothetical protein [Campylobacterota bacterium]
MQENQTEHNIKTQFVTSLMQYYKIEEDINLRAHIADLTDSIKRSQYREFFRRLSAGDMSFKNPYEKISLVAQSFNEKTLTQDESAKNLYKLMYELRKNIILDENAEGSDQERFEAIYISKIKDKTTGKLLLNAEDIDVIRNLGKRWIFDNVAADKSYFLEVVNAEYNRVRLHVRPQLTTPKGV